ncbi:MAG: hypothetical protein J6X92_02090 [Bacteroidales bacterium]|nr:hypothetical protein [Bacteroidales bacterium]
MEIERIKYLINKYYKGLSTEEEELELKDLLALADSPEYDAEREILGYYDSCEKIPDPSADFEKKIKAAITEEDSKQEEPTVVMKKVEVSKDEKEEKGKEETITMDTPYNPWRKVIWANIAALFLVAVGSYLFFTNYKKEPKDTFDDPQIAYNETMKILNELSQKIKKGAKPLTEIKKLNTTAQMGITALTNSSIILNENTSLSE